MLRKAKPSARPTTPAAPSTVPISAPASRKRSAAMIPARITAAKTVCRKRLCSSVRSRTTRYRKSASRKKRASSHASTTIPSPTPDQRQEGDRVAQLVGDLGPGGRQPARHAAVEGDLVDHQHHSGEGARHLGRALGVVARRYGARQDHDPGLHLDAQALQVVERGEDRTQPLGQGRVLARDLGRFGAADLVDELLDLLRLERRGSGRILDRRGFLHRHTGTLLSPGGGRQQRGQE